MYVSLYNQPPPSEMLNTLWIHLAQYWELCANFAQVLLEASSWAICKGDKLEMGAACMCVFNFALRKVGHGAQSPPS